MTVLYEDNHIIIINKGVGEIVQGDKTGDKPLPEIIKEYLKDKYNKPGNVFCGVAHRLDRPTSGVVVFAKTSKALERLNKMFAEHRVQKTYWAIVQSKHTQLNNRQASISSARAAITTLEPVRLEHYIYRNEKQNKSYAYDREKPKSKFAALTYEALNSGTNYTLIEVNLHTGRHHQIRCQLAAIGHPIKGDLKYGAARSNPDGGICLHARSVKFIHPVSQEEIYVKADVPADNLWRELSQSL